MPYSPSVTFGDGDVWYCGTKKVILRMHLAALLESRAFDGYNFTYFFPLVSSCFDFEKVRFRGGTSPAALSGGVYGLVQADTVELAR